MAALLGVLLAWTPHAVVAQAVTDASQAPAVTLRDAVRAMLAAHPMLESARSLVDAAEGDRRDTALWTNPVLDASWNPGVVHNTYDRLGYFSFGVTQFFELAGAPSARGSSARALVESSRADVANVVLSLSLDVESSLIVLVVARRRLDVLAQTLGRMEDVERVIRARVAAGAAPDYDAMRIAIAMSLARADVASAEADVRRARGLFEASVGPGATRLTGAVDHPIDTDVPLPPIETLVARLQGARPDVLSAERRADAARWGVTAATRSVMPGISIRLGGGFGQSPGQWDLGLGVAIPIPGIDHGQGSIRAAEARSAAARTAVDALRFVAERRLRGIHAEVLRRREALQAYAATATPTETRILDEARAGYEAGRFSVLELADAYGAWRDAQLRALDLASDARLAEIDLARELGSVLHEPEP